MLSTATHLWLSSRYTPCSSRHPASWDYPCPPKGRLGCLMAPNHLPVILFPFPFCSPVLLPNAVAFSVLPFFCCHSFLLTFIPHNVLHYFSLRDRPFSMALVEQLRCGMCSLLPYGTGVCHTFSYNCILLLFLAIPSAPLSLSLWSGTWKSDGRVGVLFSLSFFLQGQYWRK